MKRFNPVSALWGAFYSPDLYRDVVFRWKGIGFLYLLLVLAICWLPSAARWFQALRELDGVEAQALVRKLPSISIEDGVMSANPPGRHVIPLESERSGTVEGLIIIDDSAESVPNDLTTEAFVLTRREVGVIRPSRSERRVWTLTPAADMDVTPDDVQAFLGSLAFWMTPVGYVGAVAGSLVFRVLQALLYGAAAMAYARRQRLNLTRAASMRLAAVAVTPVLLLRTAIWFGPWEPAWYWRWPVGLLIAALYIAYGLRACAEAPKSEMPDQSPTV